MKLEKTGLVVILLLLAVFIGISVWSVVPTEQVIEDAVVIAEEQFHQEKETATHEVANFSLYLPDGYEIEEETSNNILLTRDSQTYILFYNSFEDETSQLNYEAAKDSANQLRLESFKDDNRFGYISITEQEDQSIQLQIGVGGVKITTISEMDHLLHDAEQMMKMANSIAYEDHS
ncbi:hypothetical protein SAMN04487944_113120 [Gracilibacillus ureilyticus]|uniref:Uncharacterized protein n=1 Tax=Gracilibacillus ureilyticus TaxID=531814 RepID=A0A1H9TDU2_9BACI|nr:hypothetical protein [Gracilibacillus ureilyticus]SER95134.1 hypothetical protein SAMN04487944_113120 [Gracilibacillus ureilyticus]